MRPIVLSPQTFPLAGRIVIIVGAAVLGALTLLLLPWIVANIVIGRALPGTDPITWTSVLMTVVTGLLAVVSIIYCRNFSPTHRAANRFGIHFCAPPGWPQPPSVWVPELDWVAPAHWPSAPLNWVFWRDAVGTPTLHPRAVVALRANRSIRLAAAVAAGVYGALVAAMALRELADSSWGWVMAVCSWLIAASLGAARVQPSTLDLSPCGETAAANPTLGSSWSSRTLVITPTTTASWWSGEWLDREAARQRRVIRRSAVAKAITLVVAFVFTTSGLAMVDETGDRPFGIALAILPTALVLSSLGILSLQEKNVRALPRMMALITGLTAVRGTQRARAFTGQDRDLLLASSIQPPDTTELPDLGVRP